MARESRERNARNETTNLHNEMFGHGRSVVVMSVENLKGGKVFLRDKISEQIRGGDAARYQYEYR